MLRSTRVVLLLSIAVQAAGFVRTVIIAAEFGASLDVDAYYLGIIAPTFISTVIGGWLQVAFVGRYAGLVATKETETAAAYRTRMLVLVALIAVICAALCVLLPAQIMNLFLPDSKQAVAATAADALRVTGCILIPIIIGDFIGLVLNSHGLFFAAALAPLVNAAVSVLALWLWPVVGLPALVWSLLIGSTAQLLIVVAALALMRLSFPLKTDAARGELMATIAIALPLVPAIMLSNSANAILQFRSAELGEGAVAVLGYATRLHNALGQVVVMGLGTVLLPHFASLWARGETDEIIELLRRLARIGLLVCGYLLGGIYILGTPTVSLLLKRGAFDAETAQRVGHLWAVLTISLFPFALGTFIAKLCQAMRQSKVILASGVVSFAAIWTVSLFGAEMHSLPLIALATGVASLATAIFWLFWLSWITPAKAVIQDILRAVLQVVLVLAPPILLDLSLRAMAAPLPPLANILVRGLIYSTLVAALIYFTGFYRWFFARAPGIRHAYSKTELSSVKERPTTRRDWSKTWRKH